ncbi:BMP family ABC transporter substrate-binding protein [Halorubellus sp. JP-L1]|uniref:BMP family ABC transporter substrate-binding protein n=1 Tax=Halorubellus sp. JP-L1 TaxID=2715753 RepID=UPI00140981BF|nr:BMP family ABC transporter substrate-binding protein [Halorubellus sp. JP-L1]NHN41849.1 BMP family ABC transporter substrate-binding protein [Halorubellus sp. JP-L1]
MPDRLSQMRRRKLVAAIGAGGISGIAGCLSGDNEGDGDGSDGDTASEGTDSTNGGGSTEGDGTVKVAWIYISPVGDLGFAAAHERARNALEEEHDWIETNSSEEVAPPDIESTLRNYASQGYDAVFSTSVEYQDAVVTVAEDNPDMAFNQLLSTVTEDNVGSYYVRNYQSRFLQGVAAGMVTESDTIGFVASFPIPVTLRMINAYALGARLVNPEATTLVRFTSAWFAPQDASQAAQSMIDEGADVLTTIMDSTATVKTANDNGVWGGGAFVSQANAGGENYLASAIINWNEFYEPELETVRNDSFEGDWYWGGMNDGIVALDEWGPSVPQEVKDRVEEEKQNIIDNDHYVWKDSKFSGWNDERLFNEMSSYVEGVEGEVPS